MSRIPSVLLVGINGYGNLYAENILALRAQGKVELAGIVDPTAAKSPRLAELSAGGKVPVLDTLDEFFATGAAPDLACIATPIGLHCEQACAALEHGVNVLCEKPAAGCLADADRMAAAEMSSGKFLAIGYQMSFSTCIQRLKADILAGRFGSPVRFRTRVLWSRTLKYFGRNGWSGRLRDAAGRWVNDSPVNNATAHYLHNMLYVLGDGIGTSAEPADIEARLWRANDIENFDSCAMRVRTKGGVDLFFYTAHPVGECRGPEFEYVFEKGTVRCTGEKNRLSIAAEFADGSTEDYGNPYDTYMRKLTDSMAKSADPAGPPLVCTIATARPHMQCIEALRALPVEQIPRARTHFEEKGDGDRLLVADGMFERMMAAYDAWTLPE